MKRSNTISTSVALLAASTLAACAGDVYRPSGGYSGSYSGGYLGSTGSAYSADEATAERVRRALAADARVGAASLTVKVVNGVVELGGSPKDLQARDLAIRITERQPGVRSVLNNLVFN